jgi:DNA-binding MarR family transcriptional regulator
MSKSSFGFKRPEDSPGFLLWQVTMIWQRAIKSALEPYNITHPQFVIMALLLWFSEQKIEPIQSMIIEKSKLDKMTVSGSIKKLVQLELLQRKESKDDTRAKTVKLATKGKVLMRKLVSIIEGVDDEFFAILDASDRQKLTHLLAHVSRYEYNS